LGPNGAGKSTLINVILKMQRITKGNIINEFENLPKYKIGFHSQDQSFYKLMKVKEILDLFLFEGEYDSLVKKYGLERNLNQKIGELSTGEYKKLSLIILLENDPDIIFIDEVTTGLDATTRKDVIDFLKNELKKHEKTFIMVTHYLEEVKELSERLIFLKNGKIIEIGLKNELLVKYGLNKKVIIKMKTKINLDSYGFKNVRNIDEDTIQLIVNEQQNNELLQLINENIDKITTYNILESDISELYHKIVQEEKI
jgi:ABC-2 type transport system ATP-binding protein